MASGIDTSARFISLAVNIAVMGFILVEGIFSFLRGRLPPETDAAQLRSLAEGLSGGSTQALGQDASSLVIPAGIAQEALAHGFGWVMLYGGISVWLFALASATAFGVTSATRRTETTSRESA